MLLTEFLSSGIASLESLYPTAEARSIMLMLCSHVLGTKSYTHILEPSFTIDSRRLPLLQESLDRLVKGEPIQYVIGLTEFCGFTFKVNHDVLIPRPETELLCREAIKMVSRKKRMRGAYGKSAGPVRVLDLCTGSGNIAWTLALSVPGAVVVGVDISPEALAVASGQDFARELKDTGAIAPTYVQADILLDPHAGLGKFDVILSNPPYIMESEKKLLRRNVLEYEPARALFVTDEDPLVYYRAVAAWSLDLMAPDARCLTEINECLGPETRKVFTSAGFTDTEIIRDFYDRNRFIYYALK